MGKISPDLMNASPPIENAEPSKSEHSSEPVPHSMGPVMPRREYFDWRAFDPAIHLREGDPFAEESTTYGKHLGELLAYEGQYVLIKGSEIVGIFPTRRVALGAAVDRFFGESAMVKQIAVLEPIEVLGHVLT